MNKLTFMDRELANSMDKYDISVNIPDMWDCQTLAILHTSNDIKRDIMNNIRSSHKPSSHSEGTGYEIDVYTNLNYSMSERNPAMRNIRVVYCDMNILTLEALNRRFPNSYKISVNQKTRREPISYELFTRRDSREILEVSSYRRCP